MSGPLAVDTTRYPGPLRAWWLVGIFCFAAIVSYTDRLVLSALVDPIKHTLAVGDSAVSLLQGAAFALVYVFAGLWLGRLADRRRRLTVVIMGSMVWCAGTVACGLAPVYGLLFLARIVVGVGEAALAPAAVSIIADTFRPERRGAAIGVFMMGFVVGGPASITIGSLALSSANRGTFSQIPGIGALEPWRIVLVLVGAFGLLVPALLLTLREPSRQNAALALPLRAMVTRLVADWRSLAPTYLALSLLAIGDYAVLAWMPSVLSRRFVMPIAEIGALFGAITGVTAALGCLIGGIGSDAAARARATHGRLRFSLAFALAASVGALLVMSANLHWALCGLGLWSLCSTTGSISGVAAIQNLVPNEYRGVGMALVAFCNTLLGLGFGPTLVAVFTEQVYRDPLSVGLAITTIALPAAVTAAMLFLSASRGVARLQPQSS